MSSFHTIVFGSFTSPAPLWAPGCHTAKKAPTGSAKTAIRPTSMTSMGPMKVCPPLAVTLAATSSALSTLMYVSHDGGACGFSCGPRPATAFWSISAIV